MKPGLALAAFSRCWVTAAAIRGGGGLGREKETGTGAAAPTDLPGSSSLCWNKCVATRLGRNRAFLVVAAWLWREEGVCDPVPGPG